MNLKNTKRILLLTVAIAMVTVGLSSCSKEEKVAAKSMEQLRTEKGVPVKVQEIQAQNFEKYLSFFSKLSGIKQTSKFPMVNDKIKSIKVKLGSKVTKGQVLVTFPTDNPAIQYTQAKTGLDNAEKTYNRMKALVEAGESAQQNLDNIETQYLVNKRNFEALNQMLNIESPISGTVVELPIEVGDVVDNKRKLFTVAQTHIMKAKVWASQEEVSKLKMGMPATLVLNGKEYTGKVTEIGLAMDERKHAFAVEIQVRNPRNELKTGTTADVKIGIYQNKEAIVIPRNIIARELDKEYVYLNNNVKAVKTYIETGKSNGLDVEVLSGLNVGDKVITQGLSLVKDGSKINLIK